MLQELKMIKKSLCYRFFDIKSDKTYDEVVRYLREACHHIRNRNGKMHYFFDGGETKFVITDNRKIGISSLVEEDIIESVEHILKSGRRGNYLD